MTLDYAVSVLVSASDVRAQQWEGVAEGIYPSELVSELWEVRASDETKEAHEAQDIADEIRTAIATVKTVRTLRGKIFGEQK